MGLRESTDGNRDTQLSKQNYAKRTTTRPREAKNMKIYSKIRKTCHARGVDGLYEPENAIFGSFLMIFSAHRMKNSREKKKFRSNKAFHRTAHKLPKLHGLATINLVAASTYCACAPSGER